MKTRNPYHLLSAGFSILAIAGAACFSSCGLFNTSGSGSGGGGGQTYSFTSISKNLLKSSGVGSNARLGLDPQQVAATLPNSCTDNFCITPLTLTGKYYGVGLMMQVQGSGMNAYFGQDSWSAISGTSPTYDFNSATPITQSGNLTCCVGSGTFSSNSYFSDAIYLFAYLDSTFALSASSGASGSAVGNHTVRFILADEAVSLAKRGDIQYKDTDGQFKWIDNSTGDLTLTRPTTPITMNTKVSNWENPYGETKGQQKIPVIGSAIADPASGKHTVTEADLKVSGRIYSFDFPSEGFLFFPSILRTGISALSSRKALLQNIHIQGLPHSAYPSGSALSSTSLVITTP